MSLPLTLSLYVYPLHLSLSLPLLSLPLLSLPLLSLPSLISLFGVSNERFRPCFFKITKIYNLF